MPRNYCNQIKLKKITLRIMFKVGNVNNVILLVKKNDDKKLMLKSEVQKGH